MNHFLLHGQCYHDYWHVRGEESFDDYLWLMCESRYWHMARSIAIRYEHKWETEWWEKHRLKSLACDKANRFILLAEDGPASQKSCRSSSHDCLG